MFQIYSLQGTISFLFAVIAIYFYLDLYSEKSFTSMAGRTVTTNAGIVMPRLIYGTAWKKEATKQLVIQAVLNGFRGIDTACQPKHYR